MKITSKCWNKNVQNRKNIVLMKLEKNILLNLILQCNISFDDEYDKAKEHKTHLQNSLKLDDTKANSFQYLPPYYILLLGILILSPTVYYSHYCWSHKLWHIRNTTVMLISKSFSSDMNNNK